MTDETGSGPAAEGENSAARPESGHASPLPGPGGPPPGYVPHPAGYGRPWAPKPGIIPLRPLTLGEILDGSFTAMRWNPKVILIPSVIVAVIEGVAATVISVIGQQTILTQARAGDAGPGQVGASFAVLGVTYGVLALAAFFGTVILTGFVTSVIGQAVLGRKETLADAWRAVRPRLWPVIGALLLSSLFVGLGWILSIALSVGAGFLIGAGAHLVPLGVVAGIVCGLTATVFAVIVAVRWIFAIPAVVLEHAGPLQSLGRSWRLVRGSWWRVFGIMLLVTLIVGFVSTIIRTPFQIGTLVTAAGTAGGISVLGAIVSAIGVIISTAVTAPLQAGAVVVLYTDLRMRREGMDIALQASTAAGVPVPGTVAPGTAEPGAW